MADFKDRVSQHARETTRPGLAHQSRGRPLNATETAFADALSAAFRDGAKDFEAVAETLKEKRIAAPVSGRVDWSVLMLEEELKALNAELDAAYQEAGYGA